MREVVYSYKKLIVWQRAIEVANEVYKLTSNFPKEEIYGLTSQMRRSAVSISSNIAEGRYRGTKKDYLHFLRIAYGSGAELESQIEIAKNFYKNKNLEYKKVEEKLLEVMKMLNVIIRKLINNKAN